MSFFGSEFEGTDSDSEYSNTSERSRHSSNQSLVSSESDTSSNTQDANSITRVKAYIVRNFSSQVPCRVRSALKITLAESAATQEPCNRDHRSNIVASLNNLTDDEGANMCSYLPTAATVKARTACEHWQEIKIAPHARTMMKPCSDLIFSTRITLSGCGATVTTSVGAMASNCDSTSNSACQNLQCNAEDEITSMCSNSSAGQRVRPKFMRSSTNREKKACFEINQQMARNQPKATNTINSVKKDSQLTLNEALCSSRDDPQIQADEEWKEVSTDSSSSTSQSGLAKRLTVKSMTAYENWLEAKKQQMLQKAERNIELKEKKRQEQENRERLAAARYEQWLETKAGQTPSCQKLQPKESKQMSFPTFDKKQSQLKLEQWQLKKRIAEERQRKQKTRQEEYRLRCEEQRRKQAAEAWTKWSSQAVNKPKPAPLNRGFSSLLGNPPMFVNPNKWEEV